MKEQLELFERPKVSDLSGPCPGLPAAFDENCNRCHKPMERMPVIYRTDPRPFATFQCPHCAWRVFIFEAPKTPLIISLDDFKRAEGAETNMAELVARKLDERKRKREVQELRETGVLIP